jgi:hypothetical protein
MTLQELVESSNCRWLPKPSAIPGEELRCFWLEGVKNTRRGGGIKLGFGKFKIFF